VYLWLCRVFWTLDKAPDSRSVDGLSGEVAMIHFLAGSII
jgi:hypothetical protein